LWFFDGLSSLIVYRVLKDESSSSFTECIPNATKENGVNGTGVSLLFQVVLVQGQEFGVLGNILFTFDFRGLSVFSECS
jgi:hypothetical protein